MKNQSKKAWQLPELTLISTAESIHGGAVHVTAREGSVTGGGNHYLTTRPLGIGQRLVPTAYFNNVS